MKVAPDMRIDHHIIHDDAPQVERLLQGIGAKLDLILKKLEGMMATLEEKIASLETAVNEETSVDESVVALLTNLTAMVADLKSNQTDPATAARIDALVAQVQANKTKLSEAVTANTPAP